MTHVLHKFQKSKFDENFYLVPFLSKQKDKEEILVVAHGSFIHPICHRCDKKLFTFLLNPFLMKYFRLYLTNLCIICVL